MCWRCSETFQLLAAPLWSVFLRRSLHTSLHPQSFILAFKGSKVSDRAPVLLQFAYKQNQRNNFGFHQRLPPLFYNSAKAGRVMESLRLSLPTGLHKRSHAGIVFTQWSQNRFFAPQGRHVAPINVKFGTGERTMPNFTFIGEKCGNTAPKTLKISNVGHNFASQGRLICTIFTKSQRLYASIDSF